MILALPRTSRLPADLRSCARVHASPSVRAQTQFEAWLACQETSVEGLHGAPRERQRLEVHCIHGATKGLEEHLFTTWAERKLADAKATLAAPDVMVTNKSDKDVQLRKLEELNEAVIQIHFRMQRRRTHKASLETSRSSPTLTA